MVNSDIASVGTTSAAFDSAFGSVFDSVFGSIFSSSVTSGVTSGVDSIASAEDAEDFDRYNCAARYFFFHFFA